MSMVVANVKAADSEAAENHLQTYTWPSASQKRQSFAVHRDHRYVFHGDPEELFYQTQRAMDEEFPAQLHNWTSGFRTCLVPLDWHGFGMRANHESSL